jgi:histidine ammonia-lyase
MHVACLAQALDLRGLKLRGERSLALYQTIREHVPFVEYDQPLDRAITALSGELRKGTA